MSYATLAELKDWIDVTDAVDDAQLQMSLDSATSVIDSMCGRTFALQTDVVKLYWPRSTDVVEVVDLISATSIKSDSHGDRTYATTLEPTDYELLPYHDASGLPSVRYQEVHIWPTSSKSFSTGRQVQITGDFGYVESGGAPASVKQACLILASRYWKRHETPLGVLGVTDVGQFERLSKEDPDVRALLTVYMRSSASGWVLV
jgi:hypothetical protein